MTITLIHGDNREVMAGMESDSVDAVVCDPPYGLEFMGKEWDKLDTRQPNDATFHKSGSGPHDRSTVRYLSAPSSYGGSVGAGMQAWHQAWATEAFRVLKPGGHIVAFGGTRTFHRLTCAIEDAGFEIRDCLMWMYGSGFPKSLDVSKATNSHPTVKPVDLMRWLCRLVTPPGGLILDPFVGSGTTMVAALLEGFSGIGIDQSAEYVELAHKRIDGIQMGGLL